MLRYFKYNENVLGTAEEKMNSMMLLSSSKGLGIGSVVGIAVVALVAGLAIGLLAYAIYAKKKVGVAKSEAKRIIEEANLEAKSIRQDEILKGNEIVDRQRAKFEEEVTERKSDLQKRENRILEKEEAIGRKQESLEQKLDLLSRRSFELDQSQKDIEVAKEKIKVIEEDLKNSQEKVLAEVERVAGMSKKQAEEQLKADLLDGVKKAVVAEAKEIEEEARETAEKQAQTIIAEAIARCASEYTVENTTSVVELANDEIKAKIIGRQGRNIRAIESVVGVDV